MTTNIKDLQEQLKEQAAEEITRNESVDIDTLQDRISEIVDNSLIYYKDILDFADDNYSNVYLTPLENEEAEAAGCIMDIITRKVYWILWEELNEYLYDELQEEINELMDSIDEIKDSIETCQIILDDETESEANQDTAHDYMEELKQEIEELIHQFTAD